MSQDTTSIPKNFHPLLLSVIAVLVIILGIIIYQERNSQAEYNKAVSEKRKEIKLMEEKMAERSKERIEDFQKHAAELEIYKKKSEVTPKIIIKYVKEKDSLRILPADEQFSFFAGRLSSARKNGRW